ncbi:hypothetical protein ACU4GR_01895 [Methylobacterium oryzae CBMB20]
MLALRPNGLSPNCRRGLYRLRLGGLVISDQRQALPEVVALAGP